MDRILVHNMLRPHCGSMSWHIQYTTQYIVSTAYSVLSGSILNGVILQRFSSYSSLSINLHGILISTENSVQAVALSTYLQLPMAVYKSTSFFTVLQLLSLMLTTVATSNHLRAIFYPSTATCRLD